MKEDVKDSIRVHVIHIHSSFESQLRFNFIPYI